LLAGVGPVHTGGKEGAEAVNVSNGDPDSVSSAEPDSISNEVRIGEVGFMTNEPSWGLRVFFEGLKVPYVCVN
jgi:hypothetical protein